jgi:hypothetical protein
MNTATAAHDRSLRRHFTWPRAFWVAIGLWLIYGFVSKHGPLLAYLKSSALMWTVVTVLLTAWVSLRLRDYIRDRHHDFYLFSRLYKIGTGVFPLAFGLGFFWVVADHDRYLIARMTDIPIQVLMPCSYAPLSPEHEQAARKLFALGPLDDFGCAPEDNAYRRHW